MSDNDSVPDWSPEAVLRRLADEKGPGEPVSIQLFLGDQVDPDDIPGFVGQAAQHAAAKLGLRGDDISMGKPFKLARSIGMTAPLPVIRELMAKDEFVNLLPSDVDDIMMKPVRKD